MCLQWVLGERDVDGADLGSGTFSGGGGGVGGRAITAAESVGSDMATDEWVNEDDEITDGIRPPARPSAQLAGLFKLRSQLQQRQLDPQPRTSHCQLIGTRALLSCWLRLPCFRICFRI